MFYNIDECIKTIGLSKEKELEGHLNVAAEILGISLPPISFFSHIVLTPQGSKAIIGSLKEYPRQIIGIFAGVYEPGPNSIYIALFDRTDKPYSFGRILFVALHELRHVWQYKYECENQSGLFSCKKLLEAKSVSHFKSNFEEVDADAWAALFLERKTNYLPHKTDHIISQDFTRDKKRFARMKELRKEYFPYESKSSKVA